MRRYNGGMDWALTAILSIVLAQGTADPMRTASDHLDAGRYAEAVAVLKDYVARHPDDLSGVFNLALAQSLAGDAENAATGFRRALELKPGLFEAQLNLGQVLVGLGRFTEAEEPLKGAAAAKPDDVRVVYLQARILLGLNRARDAAPLLARVVALDPANLDRKLELAETLERAGMKPEAKAAWAQAIESPAARERLALILLDEGDITGAITHLEALMKQQPTAAVAYALATAYLRDGKPEKSVPLAQAMVEQEPSNAEARLFLGRLWRDQKQYGPAAQQFQAAARLKPDSLEAWNEFTAALVLLQQHEAALAGLERVRALGGETPAYHYLRATLLDARKELKPALESYQKFLAASEGKHPEEEFKARQRVRMLERMLRR